MGITLYRGLNDSFKINSSLLSSVHERLKLHQFLDIPPVIYHHASRALSYGTHALCNKKIKQKETKEARCSQGGYFCYFPLTENLSYQMKSRRFYLYMLLFFLGILLDSLLSSASTENKEKCSNIFQITNCFLLSLLH